MRAILISLSRRVVRFDWLGNAPTREQIVYCFILAGEREPQGSHGEIQFAVTKAGSLRRTPTDTLTRSSGSAGRGAEPGTNANAVRYHSAEKSAFPRKKTCVSSSF
jgi:hypothetical protein